MTALSSLYGQRGKIPFRSGAVCPHRRFHSGAARPCGRIRPAVRRARRQAPGVYRNSADYTKEALIKSATADVERFFGGLRFEKRRNTLCISSFSNRKADEKDPTPAAGDLFRDSLYSGSAGRNISASGPETICRNSPQCRRLAAALRTKGSFRRNTDGQAVKLQVLLQRDDQDLSPVHHSGLQHVTVLRVDRQGYPPARDLHPFRINQNGGI